MEKLKIYVASDSLGETGEVVIRAAISQFETDNYEILKYPHIKSINDLKFLLEKMERDENPILIYTLVKKELIDYIKTYEKETDLKTLDLLSSVIDALSEGLGMSPAYESGAIRRLDDQYFSRIEAIEFAVKYDDGKDPRGFKEADLVLLGVSRTSKTPLSMYLANKNIKVANLPLVMGMEPAKEIFEIPKNKIIGLTNSPENLNQIREERLKSLGLPNTSSYASLEKILEELEYADGIMKKVGCPIIDVSNKAIEETSEIIISLLRKMNSKII